MLQIVCLLATVGVDDRVAKQTLNMYCAQLLMHPTLLATVVSVQAPVCDAPRARRVVRIFQLEEQLRRTSPR